MKIKLVDPADVRLSNIVDMALTFSAMIRLYEKGSKKKLHKEILHILPKIAKTTSHQQFQKIHNKFCLWGIKNLFLAKNSGPPSYGQIAKTLDVVLKVAIYYSKWPNEPVSEKIGNYIHAAVDTKMMAFLKSKYPDHFEIWPVTVGSVNRPRYVSIQELVRQFIADQHGGEIMPVQFDDLYWNFLNR